MNVNPVNSGQALKETSFKGITEDNYSDFVSKTDELSDQFVKTKKNGKKSRLGILASILLAAGVTFAGGKLLGDKLTKLLPENLRNKISAAIEKGANSKVFQTIGKGVDKIKGKPGEIIKKGYDGAVNAFKGKNNIANLIGLGTMATFGKEVISVDKNGDGIQDIKQKNLYAYKNASEKLGVVGDLMRMFS